MATYNERANDNTELMVELEIVLTNLDWDGVDIS